MNLSHPFEFARGIKPDALGRITLVDGNGVTLTHLPLATAYELTEDRSPVRVGDAYIVHDGDGYGDCCRDGSGFGDGCYAGSGYGCGDGYGFGYGANYGGGDGIGSGSNMGP